MDQTGNADNDDDGGSAAIRNGRRGNAAPGLGVDMSGLKQNNQKNDGSNQDSHGAPLLFADRCDLLPTAPWRLLSGRFRQRHEPGMSPLP